MDTSKVKKPTRLSNEEMMALEQEEGTEPSVSLTEDQMRRIEEEEAANEYPDLQSALVGAQDIALMGYGPNILAGIKTKSFSSPEYVKERDILNAEIERMKREDPGSFMSGQVAGGLGTALIPMGAAAKGAGLLGRMGRAAIAGGAAGLAQDVPDVEGMVQSPLAKEALMERGQAGAMGALLGPAMELGVSAIRSVSPSSVERAFQALSPDKGARTEVRLAEEAGGLATKRNIIDFAKQEGIMSGVPSIKEIYNRALSAKRKYGPELDQIYKMAENASHEISHGGITPETTKFYLDQKDISRIKSKILDTIEEQDWSDVDKNRALNSIKRYFEKLPNELTGETSLTQLHDIKTSLGKKAFKEGKAMRPSDIQEFWRKAGRIVDEEIGDRVEAISKFLPDQALSDALKQANKNYSLSSTLYNLSSEAVDSAGGIKTFSDALNRITGGAEPQIALSKMGEVIEAIPQALKPSGASLAVPFAQIGRDDYRMQNAREMINQALMQGAPPFLLDKEVQKSPLSPTEKAQLRKQITEQGTN